MGMSRWALTAIRPTKRAASVREVLVLGALLAFGVIAWEHVVHAYLLGHVDTAGGHVRHWLRDSLLALPMALAAVGLALTWGRLLRLRRSTADLLGRAALASLFMGMFLVPATPIHNQVDALTDGSHGLIAAQHAVQPTQVLADEHYGHFDAAQANPSLVQLEEDYSITGQALHGVHDALIGEAAALPLAILGILLLNIGRLRRAERLRPSSRLPGGMRLRLVGRRLALTGSGLVVAFAVYGSGATGQPAAQPVFAASDPCSSSSTPTKAFNVSAINVQISLNRFGDHDPGSFMYVLDEHINDVRAEESANKTRPGSAVSTGLREDWIQPLIIRANLGDCVLVSFTNRLTQSSPDRPTLALSDSGAPAVSMHVHGVSYQIASAGGAVGLNPNSFAAPGQTVTYKFFLDPALGEGAKLFHSHGDSRQLQAHGLFGAIIAEPQGATWLDPMTGQPLTRSNWEAIIQMPSGPSFRELGIMYHEVGDEAFEGILDATGASLPEVDPVSNTYRPGSKGINYRSEPFMDRFLATKAVFGSFDESQGYGSYTHGDPATPIPRSYLGEPTKFRLMNAGSEQAHVHHLHGGGDRWRANPGADPTNDISGGLEKTPAQSAQSIRLDSQTVDPMEAYNAEIECGAGGCQQAAGDYLFHCHIAFHYISGMFALWRVFDTLVPDLAVIAGRAAAPTAVTSTGLIGLRLPATGNRTIVPQSQLTDPTTQVSLESVVESQLAPPGARIDAQDAAVWDWQKQGSASQPVYVGEAEDTHTWANFNSASPVKGQTSAQPTPPLSGNRPQILFNPGNARYTWPLLRPHLGQRPPFSPNGHDGAPWLGGTGNATTRPDGLCPSGAPVRSYNITAITLPIQESAAGDVDPNGQIFVLNEDKSALLDAAKSGAQKVQPLAIRSNVGDCVAIIFSSQLVDNAENGNFSKVNMHTHFVQFDPQASDGVITGRSFEQSVRPFPTENRTLTAAAGAGDTQITVSSTSRLRPGISLAVGQGAPDIEVATITAITGSTLTLAAPLANSHASGESAGTEFVQYRWFSDVDSGTVFWHDHVNGIFSWGHGLFGAHIIEPPGSTYHDPKTGAVVRSGTVVDIWNTSGRSAGFGQSGSFREFMVFLHNNTRAKDPNGVNTTGCEAASINLLTEPFFERSPNNNVAQDQVGELDITSGISCPSIFSTNDPYIFSSVAHGDPYTPLWRAYAADPVVIRTIGVVERVDALRIQGHRFRRERFNGNGELQDAGTTGISERFDYVLDGGAGGPAHKAGDYLYYSTRNLAIESGAWGLFRVHDTVQPDLEVLPGLAAPPSGAGFPQLTRTGQPPPLAGSGGNPCPAGAPQRGYSVSAINRNLPMDGSPDGKGVIFALSSDVAGIQNGTLPTVPLVIRANAGDCVNITLTNATNDASYSVQRDGTRAGLSLGKVLFDPQGSSGAAIGFNPDSSVGLGQSFTYTFYADTELGTNIFLNWADQASLIHGAYGALIVEPAGSTYTSPKDNSSLSSGLQANIRSPSGKFREFAALFHDNDVNIGRSIMPYLADVKASVSALNYNATPVAGRGSDRSLVFSSTPNGDPTTTVMRAYAGDPVRFRAAVPFSANVHTFFVDGHAWPWEPRMNGSQVLYGRAITSGEFVDARLVGGAGGTESVAGDYLYGNHRMPFQRAGQWGIFRVFGTTQPDLVPL